MTALAAVVAIVGALVLVTRSEDDSVPGQVGSVNGIPFTAEDLADARAAIDSNLDYMREQIEEGSVATEHMDAFVALIEESDPSAIALAGIVVQLALYSEALDAGAQATDEQIAENVSMLREYVERRGGSLTDLDPEFQRQFDALGEERFWGEYYRNRAERSITVQNYVEQQSRDDGASEMLRTRADIERQAVAEADIDAPGDVDAALAYLERYWEWLEHGSAGGD